MKKVNKILLHLEGLAVLFLSIYLYGYFQFNWFLFIVLLFVPDIAIVGYAVSNKVGAYVYNMAHTYTVAIVILIIGLILKSEILFSIGLIWTAHIGMDRMVGYGLKYSTSFKDNHLNRMHAER